MAMASFEPSGKKKLPLEVHDRGFPPRDLKLQKIEIQETSDKQRKANIMFLFLSLRKCLKGTQIP